MRSYDDLWKAPGARLSEPKAYFVIEDGAASTNATPSETIIRYRALLAAIDLFSKAAAYVDVSKQELVFVEGDKIPIPITFRTSDLTASMVQATTRLKALFADALHADQKLAILATSIFNLVRSQPKLARFDHLLRNLDAIYEDVNKGYLLFASSFSYSKIKSEIESARVDYISKIHKTLVDIQGQLLGIPVATIVVASQLKRTEECGVEFWTNAAVLLGAWVFIALLAMSIANQWVTLSAISGEIEQQKSRLRSDYAAISDQFLKVFQGLVRRVRWHRAALIMIAVVAATGLTLANVAFARLTNVSVDTCLLDAGVTRMEAPTGSPFTI